jgi:hypothetical protein
VPGSVRERLRVPEPDAEAGGVVDEYTCEEEGVGVGVLKMENECSIGLVFSFGR